MFGQLPEVWRLPWVTVRGTLLPMVSSRPSATGPLQIQALATTFKYNLRCPCGTNKQRQAPEVMTLVKMDWGVVGRAGGEVDSVYLD